MKDSYGKLLEIISEHPMGAPSHSVILTILKELFSPEEAQLASAMSLKGLESHEIAKRAEVPVETAVSLLESMADKGVIFCVKTKDRVSYALMPPMPGFFEFSLVKGEDTPRNRRLGQLWDQYFTESLGDAMHSGKIPVSRVIPVNKKVDHGMDIFPYEEAMEIVKGARKIALGQCQCRFSVRKCDAPLDVCLLLDNWADFLIDRGLAKQINTEEAIDALKRAEEAGLIHTTPNNKTPVPYICNCCTCCCFMLRGVTELGHKSLASSRFLAAVDADKCIGCEECVALCRFKAIEMGDSGVAEVEFDNCYGCGICASKCPQDALTMVLRENGTEPYDRGADLVSAMTADRVKSTHK